MNSRISFKKAQVFLIFALAALALSSCGRFATQASSLPPSLSTASESVAVTDPHPLIPEPRPQAPNPGAQVSASERRISGSIALMPASLPLESATFTSPDDFQATLSAAAPFPGVVTRLWAMGRMVGESEADNDGRFSLPRPHALLALGVTQVLELRVAGVTRCWLSLPQGAGETLDVAVLLRESANLPGVSAPAVLWPALAALKDAGDEEAATTYLDFARDWDGDGLLTRSDRLAFTQAAEGLLVFDGDFDGDFAEPEDAATLLTTLDALPLAVTALSSDMLPARVQAASVPLDHYRVEAASRANSAPPAKLVLRDKTRRTPARQAAVKRKGGDREDAEDDENEADEQPQDGAEEDGADGSDDADEDESDDDGEDVHDDEADKAPREVQEDDDGADEGDSAREDRDGPKGNAWGYWRNRDQGEENEDRNREEDGARDADEGRENAQTGEADEEQDASTSEILEGDGENHDGVPDVVEVSTVFLEGETLPTAGVSNDDPADEIAPSGDDAAPLHREVPVPEAVLTFVESEVPDNPAPVEDPAPVAAEDAGATDATAAGVTPLALTDMLGDGPAALQSSEERQAIIAKSAPKLPKPRPCVSRRWWKERHPDARRVEVQAEPEILERDDGDVSEVALRVKAQRGRNGSPAGAWVMVSTDLGALKAPWSETPSVSLVFALAPPFARVNGRGTVFATLSLLVPAGFEGAITVSATLFTVHGAVRGDTVVTVTAPRIPEPSAVTLTSDAPTLVRAPDGNRALLSAFVACADGSPAPDGTLVAFTTTGGALETESGAPLDASVATVAGFARVLLAAPAATGFIEAQAVVTTSGGLVIASPWLLIAIEEAPAPVITSLDLFDDADGNGVISAGDGLRVHGVGFGNTPGTLCVALPQALITALDAHWRAATDAMIDVTVPATAISGAVSVARLSSRSAPVQVLIAPTFDAAMPLDPAAALPGQTITVRGTGFSLSTGENDLRFAPDVAAAAEAASATTLQVRVPTAAIDGPITLRVRGVPATSAPIFDRVTLPPVVVMTIPADGDVDVPLVTTIIARFSKPIAPSSVTSGRGGSFRVFRGDAGGVELDVAGSLVVAGDEARFTPAAYLEAGVEYMVSLSTSISDLETPSSSLEAALSFSFSTSMTPPPMVSGSTPAPGAIGVSEYQPLVVTFNQALDAGTVTLGDTFLVTRAGETAQTPGTLSVAADTVIFAPASGWQPGATYHARALIGIGNTGVPQLFMTAPWEAQFTVAALSVLSVAGHMPTAGAAEVAVNVGIVVDFSEALDPATIALGDAASVIVRAADGSQPAGAASASGARLTVNFTGALAYSTSYTVTLGAGISALSDVRVRLAAAFSFSFSTEALGAPSITGLFDASGAPVGEAQPGDLLTVTGARFGTNPTTSGLFLGDAPEAIVSFDDTTLVFVVPERAGTADVRIAREGMFSNAWPLTIVLPVTLPTFVEDATRFPAFSTAISDAIMADFTGDGRLDAVVTQNSGQSAQLYAQNAAGAFQAQSGLPFAFNVTEGGASGDLDGNGTLDLVLVNANAQANQVLKNFGGGVFQNASATLPPAFDSSTSAIVRDFDGNGSADLFIGNGQSQQDRLYLNTGSTLVETTYSHLPLAMLSTTDALAEDFTGDGVPDLLVFAATGAPRLLRNNGLGFFSTRAGAFPAGVSGVKTGVAVDADRDGDLDLIVGAGASGAPQVFFNDGTGLFAFAGAFSPCPAALTLAAVWEGARLLVFEGTDATLPLRGYAVSAGGAFEPLPSLPATPVETRKLALVDLDGDGRLDLISFNRFDRVRVFMAR